MRTGHCDLGPGRCCFGPRAAARHGSEHCRENARGDGCACQAVHRHASWTPPCWMRFPSFCKRRHIGRRRTAQKVQSISSGVTSRSVTRQEEESHEAHPYLRLGDRRARSPGRHERGLERWIARGGENGRRCRQGAHGADRRTAALVRDERHHLWRPRDELGRDPRVQHAVAKGTNVQPYIGHDEPEVQFFSNRPGYGQRRDLHAPPAEGPSDAPRQDGSGGTYDFQQHMTFWFGMQLCDDQGSPNPAGAAQTGHATVPCKPNSDANIYASPDTNSPRYFGLGPGPGLHGDAVLPAGLGRLAGRHRAATRPRSGARR